jgi:hypothetical protein
MSEAETGDGRGVEDAPATERARNEKVRKEVEKRIALLLLWEIEVE